MGYQYKLSIIILTLLHISEASTSSVHPSPATICKLTPDPSACESLLPTLPAANLHDYARFSVAKSLSQTLKFKRQIGLRLLKRSQSLPRQAAMALDDCHVLAATNADFLVTSLTAINATIPTHDDDVHTLLSAVVTNLETCRDGLTQVAGEGDFSAFLAQPVADVTRLYSVALALFTHGWVVPGKEKQLNDWLYSAKKEKEARVTVRGMVTVSQDGTGNFSTVGEAVAAATENSSPADGYFVIRVKAGVYEEYVVVTENKRYLMIVGDGVDQTIVTGNRSVFDGWTTFKSATFAVSGVGFVAVNITFRNTAGAAKHQAVAVRNSADLSTFFRCSFEGYQDTLYTHSLRQFYRECNIYGTVDFIFGNAATVFQSCNIRPRRPMPNQFNAVTAQGRSDVNQNTGISIHNCTVVSAADEGADGVKTYLGRPWKEFSRTVIMQSFIGASVDPAGWRAWNGAFALDTLYYAEYGNSGPGSDTSKRVTWPGFRVIGASDAANFTLSRFVAADEWVPRTGVDYSSGLM